MTTEIVCLKINLNTDCRHNYIGVLETSCYPAKYYAGYYFFGDNGIPCTSDNATSNFHRALDEAIKSAQAMKDRHHENK